MRACRSPPQMLPALLIALCSLPPIASHAQQPGTPLALDREPRGAIVERVSGADTGLDIELGPACVNPTLDAHRSPEDR